MKILQFKPRMLHFIACHAPDMDSGVKVADGLARVTLTKTHQNPHIAFTSKELAEFYIDARNAGKLCYIVSEEELTDTMWYDFRDGILIFKTQKDIRKALIDGNYISKLNQMAYSPAVSCF